jgi:hypothetical protein
MAAPKGNLFAIGNTGGRPPMYKTPEEFAKKLDEYIQFEDDSKGGLDANGIGKGIYTIEGAALFLGFQSRTSFYDYAKKEDFLYIIDRFNLFLTQWNVRKLYWGGTFAGAMFWLKNWGGYKDESTQHQKQEITNVTITEKAREL